MRCGTARHQLWLPQGPETLTPERGAAVAHAQHCPACRRFVAQQAVLRSLTHRCAEDVRAPVELRQRVFTRLAAARVERRVGSRQRAWLAFAGVAVAVVVTGAAWAVRSSGGWPATLLPLADEHQRALQGTGLQSSDPRVIHDWLAERVTFAPHVPDLPGASLVGARITEVHGRPGAVICYRVDGYDVSFFLAPRDDAAPPLRPTEMVGAASRGHRLVAWQGAGLTHVLVGELPEERLRALARHCLDAPVSGPGL